MLQSFKISNLSVCSFNVKRNKPPRLQGKKSVQWLLFNCNDIATIFNKVIPSNIKTLFTNYIRDTQRMNAHILWG